MKDSQHSLVWSILESALGRGIAMFQGNCGEPLGCSKFPSRRLRGWFLNPNQSGSLASLIQNLLTCFLAPSLALPRYVHISCTFLYFTFIFTHVSHGVLFSHHVGLQAVAVGSRRNYASKPVSKVCHNGNIKSRELQGLEPSQTQTENEIRFFLPLGVDFLTPINFSSVIPLSSVPSALLLDPSEAP
jgi:hypothetical protein